MVQPRTGVEDDFGDGAACPDQSQDGYNLHGHWIFTTETWFTFTSNSRERERFVVMGLSSSLWG
jgi:hypothetical protein